MDVVRISYRSLTLLGLLISYLTAIAGQTQAGWQQLGGSLNVNSNQNATAPDFSVQNNTPYVAWTEANGAANKYQIYLKFYNSSAWQAVGANLENPGYLQNVPSLAFSDTTPFVAWEESNSSSVYQIYVKFFNGNTWVQAGGTLNVNAFQEARTPSLAIYNGTPFVTWGEWNGTGNEIYVKYYNGTGWQLLGPPLNNNSALNGITPAIRFSSATPYVVWNEHNGTAFQITEKHYNGSAWVQDGASLNTNKSMTSELPDLFFYNTTPYITWDEDNGVVTELYVKHFNGVSWVADGGSINVNPSQTVYAPSLIISGTTPYVTWEESNAGAVYQIYEKHYNGSSWVLDGGSLNVNTGSMGHNPDLGISNTV